MSKRLRQFALLLLALLVLLGSGASLAEENDEQVAEQPDKVHFVLVVDCTGSMDKADAEGMSVAAAELLWTCSRWTTQRFPSFALVSNGRKPIRLKTALWMR